MTNMTFVGVFFNSLTNCITQSGIEYNPTPNISGDSHRSERLPYHTIVTKAVMTCQNEEILKCYYILIFLGVQLILINRNTVILSTPQHIGSGNLTLEVINCNSRRLGQRLLLLIMKKMYCLKRFYILIFLGAIVVVIAW